jgi:hypothetical protein
MVTNEQEADWAAETFQALKSKEKSPSHALDRTSVIHYVAIRYTD